MVACRLRGDGLFLDGDSERISGAYTIEVLELYSGICSKYACCDPCLLVY